MQFIKKMGSIFLACVMILIVFPLRTNASEKTITPESIHALSAVVLDGDTGRVLYEKEGNTKRANASTTKIMTCILALENAQENDVVKISAYAASMPRVKLGVTEGEYYYMGDLLHSLMLESHNDVAVAIAEHVDGSVAAFSDHMNELAKEIGCDNTCFLTPNGLDATERDNTHGTTATDLARIMRYCTWQSPMAARFLEITQTPQYTFSDLKQKEDGGFISGNRSFLCTNHNAYLQQNEACLSGKTGFTSDAGYCYVTSLASGEKTIVIALLGSGWPNNKNYKWQDCDLLYQYIMEHYRLRQLPDMSSQLQKVVCARAQNDAYDLKKIWKEQPYVICERKKMLLADWENLSVTFSYPKKVDASGCGERRIGTAQLGIDALPIAAYDICIKDEKKACDMVWFFCAVLKKWALCY